MIEQTVKVVAVKDDTVWVESLARHGCARCEAGQGCGGGIFAKLFGDKQFRMEISNSLLLKEGDNVVIGIPENSVTTASLWAYLLPLMGLLLGAVMGNSMDAVNEEFWTLSLALFGVVFALLLGVLRVRTQRFRKKYTPQMLRVEVPIHESVQQFEPSSV